MKRNIATAFCVLIVTFSCRSATAVTIVNDGRSDYSIVLAHDAIPAERTAARELADHLEQMSGARLPVVDDSDFDGSHGILLGRPRQLAALGVSPYWKALGKEGYVLRVVDGHLVIAGGRPRGTLYGVYWLLEKVLGCRWLAPDTTVIPAKKTIDLPALDMMGKPAFEHREPLMFIGWGQRKSRWWDENFSQAYVARTRNSARNLDVINRINIEYRMDASYGGAAKMPHTGHNMKTLVQFEKYAETHPEYYALQKHGQRQKQDEQHVDLCLTNPGVALAASQTMRQWMRKDPDADSFFIGQSDANHFCQCDQCVALHNHYGGRRSGPTLEFVNAVAERVDSDFPDMPIGTYAYQPTYRAPRGLKAHRNVVVWFCPITRCFCHPLQEGLLNQGFYKYADELDTWLRIASKVYVYDYNHGSPGVSPPADILKLGDTYRFYQQMGVRGVYVDAVSEIQVGFGFLQYWLMTQLMNDPDIDYQETLNAFLEGYYGAAAGSIRQFIDLSCDASNYAPATEKRGAIWYEQGSAKWRELREDCLVNWRHLSVPAIERSYRLFESALRAVADDPVRLRHVESARMPVQYAMLEYLPVADARLKKEAAAYVHSAGTFQLRSVGDLTLDKYKAPLSERRGRTESDW